MNEQRAPEPLRFKLTVPLPLTINGGLTRWKIQKEHFGKNGNRVAIVACCVDADEVIELISGRTRDLDHRIERESIRVVPGTKAYQIARKLLRDGWAVSEPKATHGKNPP
jgi:hypothetical protein